MKKRSIFRLFILPLIGVMVIQAVIAYSTILFGGTTKQLDDYSVGILKQMVENRRIILENNMVQQWSNLAEEEQVIQNTLKELLLEENIDIETFIKSKGQQNKLLESILSQCLYMMRKNAVTGAMVVLASSDIGQDKTECRGVYFRDADPYVNPGDYSDVLMERGSSSFSHQLSIPFDSLWTSEFHLQPDGALDADQFFYKPYNAALQHPDAGYRNLGYWSLPFCLENDISKDSYQMITYTIPLIYEDGTVYGVMGIEVSCKYLKELLPFRELNEKEQGGYMLALQNQDGTLKPLVYNAAAYAARNENWQANRTEYSDFYALEQEDTKLYAAIGTLRLYNKNTPFEDDVWIIAGLKEQNELFGIGDSVIMNLTAAILISLAFGILSAYFIAAHVTRPIRNLAECIENSAKTRLAAYKRSRIKEVDRLYEVVMQLTIQQKEAEVNLMEEKERYRIALQSSTDILFTYDIKNDTAELFNFQSESDQLPECYVEQLSRRLTEEGIIIEEDQKLVMHIIETAETEISLVCQAKLFGKDEKYHWIELNGKVIYGANGEKSKIIGSIKNIQEKKLKELMQVETFRIDPVTGLYKKQAGEELIEVERENNCGYLALFDIEDFRKWNEQYGMIFGDTILEEIGMLLLEWKKEVEQESSKQLIAVRAGGDEFLLWMGGYQREEAKELSTEILRKIKVLFGTAGPELHLNAGLSVLPEQKSYQQAFEETQQALEAAVFQGNDRIIIYEELPEEKRTLIKEKEISEISGGAYSSKMNIVSIVFNFFDKGGSLKEILPVLFAKLGHYFGLSELQITRADWEFHTTYVSSHWQMTQGWTEDEEICHFTASDFEQLAARFSSETYYLSEKNRYSAEEAKFIHQEQKANSICLPMFDNGIFMGVLLLIMDAEASYSEELQDCIQEISKIIETNINREKYDQASRAKSEFLSRMSHEIRTPMNAIIGMAAIAMEEKQNIAKVEDCLNKIGQSSEYLLSLINDILDMSKIESGKLRLEQENFSLKQLLERLNTLIEPQMEKKGIHYQTEAGEEELWLIGDSLHLNQVLINLLGNAVKFTPEHGEVNLSIQWEEKKDNQIQIRFSVSDTGIGISPENQKRIFYSFEQAENNTAREYGGTGLGLAISSRLVRMMGGNIEVESEVGRGSRFYFTVVFQPGIPEKPEEAVSEEEQENEFAGKRVLLVEDNLLNTEIAAAILKMHGFQVETAENGLEAVNAFQSHAAWYYNVILMDIRMPVMDGLEAAKQIRKMERLDAPEVPIVAMTANAFDEDMKKSIASGMNGHLAKPIDRKEFLKMLRRVLKKTHNL